MKVVLQDYQTGLYLAWRREWTQDQQRARLFASHLRARAYKLWHRLPGTCAVARLDRSASRRRDQPARGTQAPRQGPTLVEANIELGLGYTVFIRGEGDGLSWELGQELSCTRPGTWSWCSLRSRSRVLFRLLLNDQVWAKGGPVALEPGGRIVLSPDFEWPEMPMVSKLS